MADHDDITLRAHLPEVTETPSVVEVSCGLTTYHVYEAGCHGSGAWAVWTGRGGGSVVSGGTNGYPYEQALREAREYVRRVERSRLLHQALREALTYEEVPTDGR
jgi:hypothetical protein